MKKNKFFKKALSVFMAAVTMFTMIGSSGLTAFAAGEQTAVYIVEFPRSGDANSGANWHSRRAGDTDLHLLVRAVSEDVFYTVKKRGSLGRYLGKVSLVGGVDKLSRLVKNGAFYSG